ncbi:hypothetical protein CsatA_014256 [Cannabis sativa]
MNGSFLTLLVSIVLQLLWASNCCLFPQGCKRFARYTIYFSAFISNPLSIPCF